MSDRKKDTLNYWLWEQIIEEEKQNDNRKNNYSNYSNSSRRESRKLSEFDEKHQGFYRVGGAIGWIVMILYIIWAVTS